MGAKLTQAQFKCPVNWLDSGLTIFGVSSRVESLTPGVKSCQVELWQQYMPCMYAPLVPPLLTGRPIMPLCLVVHPFPVHPHLCCPCHETTEQQGAGTEYACLDLVDLTVNTQPQMDELPMVWPCISDVNDSTHIWTTMHICDALTTTTGRTENSFLSISLYPLSYPHT